MFDSIGGKIKTMAKVVLALGIIGSTIAGIPYFFIVFQYGRWNWGALITGVCIIVVGYLLSLFLPLLVYGFGELIEKTTENARNTESIELLLNKQISREIKKEESNFPHDMSF
jgi:hypothetical protein